MLTILVNNNFVRPKILIAQGLTNVSFGTVQKRIRKSVVRGNLKFFLVILSLDVFLRSGDSKGAGRIFGGAVTRYITPWQRLGLSICAHCKTSARTRGPLLRRRNPHTDES
jgi:hypothetical protein